MPIQPLFPPQKSRTIPPPPAPEPEHVSVVESDPTIKPVKVVVIGTGDGKGDGKGAPLTSDTVAMTPDHQPNLVVKVIGPALALFVRFINLFLTSFVGLVVAGMTPAGGKVLYTSDFMHLVVLCASLALPGAALGFFKDLVTVFGRLEGKYPLATGNV